MTRTGLIALITLSFSLLSSSPVRAQDITGENPGFYLGYAEGRLVLDGDRSSPWMTAHSDLALFGSTYTDETAEFGIEGVYNIWGPLSIGGKAFFQFPGWSERDNVLLGPRVQVKAGWWLNNTVNLDVTLRCTPMFNPTEEFAPGRVETSLIPVMTFGKRVQIALPVHYFWNHDFEWESDSHQFTVQFDLTVWLWREYIGVAFVPDYTRVWGVGEDGTLASTSDIGNLLVGGKFNLPLRKNTLTLWAQPLVGAQYRYDWTASKTGSGWMPTVQIAAGVMVKY
ncbi:hypothetical protein KJ903_03530 [Patescibacteria group bacterium]|nr:hypothetical protein [Patescibacteria group bacterium]